MDRPLCPLVTVTGLTGGAGATSLALALACEAANAAGRPSLLAETCDAGLREVAGVTSPFGLADVPRLARLPERPPHVWIELADTRVMTWNPAPSGDPARLASALSDARRAHSVVVLDCGIEEPPDLTAAGRTHRIYTASASGIGVARARRRLECVRDRAEAIVALVAVHGDAALGSWAARRAAHGLAEAVVFVPYHPELVTDPWAARDVLRPSAIDLLSAMQLRL